MTSAALVADSLSEVVRRIAWRAVWSGLGRGWAASAAGLSHETGPVHLPTDVDLIDIPDTGLGLPWDRHEAGPHGSSTERFLHPEVGKIALRGVMCDTVIRLSTRGLTDSPRTTDRMRMSVVTGGSEVWQARIDRDLAAQLRADSEILGLKGRTDIVKAALQLLHQRAAEERMARSVEDFYAGQTAPLPVGVRPAAGVVGDDTARDASS